MVSTLPVMLETWVRSLGWEDPLEKGMATHFSILAWRIPWTEESGGLHSVGLQRVDMTEQLTLSLFIYYVYNLFGLNNSVRYIGHVIVTLFGIRRNYGTKY